MNFVFILRLSNMEIVFTKKSFTYMHKKRIITVDDQRCIYKLDGLHNVKKIMPMPDSKIHLFGSFFLLWRCFWLPIPILHRSLSLSWRSIPSPITTFLLLRMRGSSKMAENLPHFMWSVTIPAVYPVYIYINFAWDIILKKIIFINFWKNNWFTGKIMLSNSIFLNPQKVSYFSKNKVGSKKEFF